MGYSIAARRADGHECRLARQRYPEGISHDSEIPATMYMRVEQAYLSYGGPKEDYRPYLVLVGKPEKFRADFENNIREVRFERELDQVPINYTYEFDREDLAKMAMKGLHEPGFDVPDIIKNNTFELPCKVEVYTVWGDDGTTEFPLMFVRPEDGRLPGERNSLICDNASSGYKIGDYFEDSNSIGYDATKETGPLVRDIEDEMSKIEEQHGIGYERGDREGQWQDGAQSGITKDLKAGLLTGMDYLGKEDDMEIPDVEEEIHIETEAEREERRRREAAMDVYKAMRNRADAAWKTRSGADKSTLLDGSNAGGEGGQEERDIFQDIDDRTESERREDNGGVDIEAEAASNTEKKDEFMPDEAIEGAELDRDPDDEIEATEDISYEEQRTKTRKDVINVHMNDAANIDTPGEILEEMQNGGIDVENSAYVDGDVVDAVKDGLSAERAAAQAAAAEGIPDIEDEPEDHATERKLPDMSGIEANERQRMMEQAGLDK